MIKDKSRTILACRNRFVLIRIGKCRRILACTNRLKDWINIRHRTEPLSIRF
jgi:hypothetical protein